MTQPTYTGKEATTMEHVSARRTYDAVILNSPPRANWYGHRRCGSRCSLSSDVERPADHHAGPGGENLSRSRVCMIGILIL